VNSPVASGRLEITILLARWGLPPLQAQGADSPAAVADEGAVGTRTDGFDRPTERPPRSLS